MSYYDPCQLCWAQAIVKRYCCFFFFFIPLISDVATDVATLLVIQIYRICAALPRKKFGPQNIKIWMQIQIT